MSLQSIRNNLTKARSSGIRDAEKACHYLKDLHRQTGRSEQHLLAALVVSGVENLPEFESYRASVKESWENREKNKTER